MSDRVLHPKCGKRFRNSNTEGHCSVCCETFIGLECFDQHRRAGRCILPVDGTGLWWRDDEGRWHYGKRMSDEAKAARRARG